MRQHEHNPFCGDEVTIELSIDGDRIVDARFQGRGCSISQAAASMLMETIVDMPVGELSDWDAGNMLALLGVELGPVRRKCAVLALTAVQRGLETVKDTDPSSLSKTMDGIVSEFIKVAQADEIPLNGSKLVEVDDVRIALFNLDGTLYAIEDVCTHDGGPLVEGDIVNGCQVQCPRHGARFDICTGAAVSFPAFEATNTYEVRVEGDDVLIESPI